MHIHEGTIFESNAPRADEFVTWNPSSKRVYMHKQRVSYGNDCANSVYRRRGEKHRNGGETLEHRKSKHWIAKHIACIRFKTGSCAKCFRSKYLDRSSGSYVLSAEVEKRIPGTNRIADVLLVERSVTTGFTNTFASVEVLHTHEVDADKLAECTERGVRILEVTTDSVTNAMRLHGDECATGAVTLGVRRPVVDICEECVMNSAFVCDLNNQLYHWATYDEVYRQFYRGYWRSYHKFQ